MFVVAVTAASQLDIQERRLYVETTKSWKMFCSKLPCFAELWWPNYLTKVIRTTIDDEDVIIQLWKGRCQMFGGRWAGFPGGIGAEVGIYRTVPEDEEKGNTWFKKPVERIDKKLHEIRKVIAGPSDEPVLKARKRKKKSEKPGLLQRIPRQESDGDPEGEVWYPFPQLRTQLWFRLVNPLNNEVFFQTETQETYWLTRWMHPESYQLYKGRAEHQCPEFAANFRLEFTVNGKTFAPW